MKKIVIIMTIICISIIIVGFNQVSMKSYETIVENTSSQIAEETEEGKLTKEIENDLENVSIKDDVESMDLVIPEIKEESIKPKTNTENDLLSTNDKKESDKSKITKESKKENYKSEETNSNKVQPIETTEEKVTTVVEAEVPKQEEKLSRFCLDGGSEHVEGDGPYEHGYYKTWDEANEARIEYTKGWGTFHYAVYSCACGLYYFWAKPS